MRREFGRQRAKNNLEKILYGIKALFRYTLKLSLTFVLRLFSLFYLRSFQLFFLMYLFFPATFELVYHLCLFVQLFCLLFIKWTKHLKSLSKKKASLWVSKQQQPTKLSGTWVKVRAGSPPITHSQKPS
jgi:hypothetical protein